MNHGRVTSIVAGTEASIVIRVRLGQALAAGDPDGRPPIRRRRARRARAHQALRQGAAYRRIDEM